MFEIKRVNLQINEDFVKEYNESSIDKKPQLNQQCAKIFEKIKVAIYYLNKKLKLKFLFFSLRKNSLILTQSMI